MINPLNELSSVYQNDISEGSCGKKKEEREEGRDASPR